MQDYNEDYLDSLGDDGDETEAEEMEQRRAEDIGDRQREED